MKKILIILIIFSSCVAKKNTTKTESEIKTDSIFITKDRVIIERVTDTLLVNNVCDTLGYLKPFNYSLNVPQGTVSIVGLNNNITGSIELSGYVKSLEKQIKILKNKKVSTSNIEVIKYRTPLWMWIYIVLATAIIILLIKFS